MILIVFYRARHSNELEDVGKRPENGELNVLKTTNYHNYTLFSLMPNFTSSDELRDEN